MIRWADVSWWSIDAHDTHETWIGWSAPGPCRFVYFSRVFNPEKVSA